MSLRLVIFDVDGTLVDSQADIVACMQVAFDSQGLPAPSRAAILGIVGLSLPVAMARLAPDADQDRLVSAYKKAFAARRVASAMAAVLYPGARAAIETLHAQPEILLAIATGKSKRGLDALLGAQGLERYFVSRQVADFHPSKPHPSMIETALQECGVNQASAVMVGDTTYDREMAASAGVGFVGVSWGYHSADQLGSVVIDDFAELGDALEDMWRARA